MAKPVLAPWRLYTGRGLSPNVRRLSLTSFLQDVASEMVYPLLPGFLAVLGGGAVALGAMESAAEGVLALVKGWAGRESDRRGRRKPFVVAGYGLSAATRPLLALAASALQVVALRVLDRIAKGLRTAPRDAMIADSTAAPDRGFAFSYHRGLDHLGAAVGPLLAAGILALAPGQLRLVFLLATVPAALGVLLVALRVREARGETAGAGEAAASPPREVAAAPATADAASATAAATENAPLPADAAARHAAPASVTRLPRALRLPLVAFFLFALGNASDGFLLLEASRAGIGPLGLTLLWSAFHVVKWAASAPSGRLADRLGPGRPLLAGWTIYAVAYLGFALTDGLPAFFALLALYAVHFGLTEGAERALVVALAGDAGRGSVLGAFHLVSGLGLFAASLLFGVVWAAVSPAAAFGLGATLALAATLLVAVGVPRLTPGDRAVLHAAGHGHAVGAERGAGDRPAR